MCPTCSRVLRVSCPTCCRALRASCPTCSRAVCAPFPTCFRASRASRASCPLLACHLPYMPWVWCASSQTSSRVLCVLCVVVPHVFCTFRVLGMLVARPLCALVLLVLHLLLNINDMNTLYPLRIGTYVKNEFENIQKVLKIKVWKWTSWSWW